MIKILWWYYDIFVYSIIQYQITNGRHNFSAAGNQIQVESFKILVKVLPVSANPIAGMLKLVNESSPPVSVKPVTEFDDPNTKRLIIA